MRRLALILGISVGLLALVTALTFVLEAAIGLAESYGVEGPFSLIVVALCVLTLSWIISKNF